MRFVVCSSKFQQSKLFCITIFFNIRMIHIILVLGMILALRPLIFTGLFLYLPWSISKFYVMNMWIVFEIILLFLCLLYGWRYELTSYCHKPLLQSIALCPWVLIYSFFQWNSSHQQHLYHDLVIHQHSRWIFHIHELICTVNIMLQRIDIYQYNHQYFPMLYWNLFKWAYIISSIQQCSYYVHM